MVNKYEASTSTKPTQRKIAKLPKVKDNYKAYYRRFKKSDKLEKRLDELAMNCRNQIIARRCPRNAIIIKRVCRFPWNTKFWKRQKLRCRGPEIVLKPILVNQMKQKNDLEVNVANEVPMRHPTYNMFNYRALGCCREAQAQGGEWECWKQFILTPRRKVRFGLLSVWCGRLIWKRPSFAMSMVLLTTIAKPLPKRPCSMKWTLLRNDRQAVKPCSPRLPFLPTPNKIMPFGGGFCMSKVSPQKSAPREFIANKIYVCVGGWVNALPLRTFNGSVKSKNRSSVTLVIDVLQRKRNRL